VPVKFWVDRFNRATFAERAASATEAFGSEIVLFTVSPPTVKVPMVPVVPKRFVVDAVVAKKFVVVAAVPVAFWKLKFCSVEEPVASIVPALNVPIEASVEKKLVVLATEAKSAVEVAAVAERLWRLTRPVLETVKKVEVAAVAVVLAIKKRLAFVSPLFAKIATLANGDEVPMPTLPLFCCTTN